MDTSLLNRWALEGGLLARLRRLPFLAVDSLTTDLSVPAVVMFFAFFAIADGFLRPFVTPTPIWVSVVFGIAEFFVGAASMIIANAIEANLLLGDGEEWKLLDGICRVLCGAVSNALLLLVSFTWAPAESWLSGVLGLALASVVGFALGLGYLFIPSRKREH